MSSGHLVTLLRQLRSLAGVRETAELGDRVLLARYAVDRDEAAFAALVRRHGGLVWGVCRRVLADAADADDAFQATFLVLIHKAATLHGRESIAGWLQGVAWRLARKVKAEAARRRIKETRAERAPAVDFAAEMDRRDLRGLLDDELERLPEKYRAPLVLCYLEGLSYTEAARQLGWRDGTVCGRLARARELLRKRLGHRGLTLSVAALAALAEPATAPAATLAAVTRMAMLFALGRAAGGEAVSASVSTLAQATLQAMSVAKMKAMAALVVMLGLFAAGAGVAASHLLAMKSPETETADRARTENPTTEKAERTDLYGDPLPPGALLRLGTMRLRNSEFLGSASFSPDGKIVAAGGYMGDILLYDTATGRRVRRIKAGTTEVPSLTFSPDGKTLASADSQTVRIWDPATGKELHHLAAGSGFSRDYGQARVPIVFSPKGNAVAGVDANQSIHIWDTNTGKELAKLSGHREHIRCLAFSLDGQSIASASGDRAHAGSVRVWEIGSGKEVRRISLHRPNAPMQPEPLCFAPDGKTLVLATFATEKRKQGNAILNLVGEMASFLDVATEQAQPRLELQEGRFKSGVFSSDGKLLATMNGEFAGSVGVRSEEKNRIQVWEIATGERLFDFAADAERFGLHGPNLLAFSEDGRKLTAATWAASLRIWDLERGREHLEKPNAHTDLVQRAAYSPDGRTLATASSDHTIALWDTTTGHLRGHLRGHDGPVISVAFSSDGQRLASASSHPEQSVRLWDVASGKELRRYEVPMEPIGDNQSVGVSTTVSFAAEGKILAAGGTDRKIRLWDVSTGKEIRNGPMRGLRLPPQGKANDWWPNHVWDVASAPDGRLMALYAAKVLSFVDSITGQALYQYQIGDNPPITVLALSPDGKTLLGGAGESVFFLEVAGGAKLYEAKLAENVFGAAFSPDGRTVAVSMGEKNATILLLDVRTGQELLRLGGHGSRSRGLTFSPDGKQLASAQWDTTALIWDVSKARRNPLREDLTPKDLDRLWTGLLDADAPKAHAALWALVAAPDKAVPFLHEHLQPVPRVTPDRLHRLIADLDADEFARREESSRELTKLGMEAEPALSKALEGKPSLEMRRRVEALLHELTCQTEMTPDALRQLRAIQVLEQIGSPQARQILASLAQGAPAAPATRDAAAAVARLNLTQQAAPGPRKTDRR